MFFSVPSFMLTVICGPRYKEGGRQSPKFFKILKKALSFFQDFIYILNIALKFINKNFSFSKCGFYVSSIQGKFSGYAADIGY